MPTTWPAPRSMPLKKTPAQHLPDLIAAFHELRQHPELAPAMTHLAAAIRGVEDAVDPAVKSFAADFPEGGE